MTDWLRPTPLIAILRGLTPEDAVATGGVIVDAGFHILEVPLNSPRPIDGIKLLAKEFGAHCLIGAGTVMTVKQVGDVAAAGGRLIVMPHADTEIIRAAKEANLVCVPGVATPTEAVAALKSGADALKLFPAEQTSPAVLKAWRSVLPPDTAVLPVGGVTPDGMAAWIACGAAGFGIGSALYKPGRDRAEIKTRATGFITHWRHPTKVTE